VVTPPGPPPYPRRTSIAYFHSPNADALIEPLPGRSPAAGADIEPVLAGRYLQDKIARYHAARATTSPPP
jgi:isopenicillin N synthase-like dioxygenase